MVPQTNLYKRIEQESFRFTKHMFHDLVRAQNSQNLTSGARLCLNILTF